MSFVQTSFLYASIAVSIPLIVHFIFRWQTRRVELGTIRFLSEIIRNNARRKRIQRWLLLLLRVACVALLVALFARPFLLATEWSGQDRFAVLLIDRSASMGMISGGRRIVDRALDRGKELITSAGDSTRWEVALFDHRVHPLGQGDSAAVSPAKDIRSALVPPSDLFGATDFGAAMEWARDACIRARPGPKDVFILTDLQRSGLGWTPTEAFPADVTLHVEDFGKPLTNNVAVTSVIASNPLPRPDQRVTLTVTLFNHGPFPLDDVPLTLNLVSGRRSHRLRQATPLDPGKAVQLDFQLPELSAGLWQGAIELDMEDELSFDNTRHVAVLSAPARRVLIMDGGDGPDGSIAESFFLETALRLAARGETFTDSRFAPEVVRVAVSGMPSLIGVDLAVLVDVGSLSAAEAERLAAWVRQGGGLVVFTGERMTPDVCRRLQEAGLAPGEITGIARATDLPFRWQKWDDEHPLLEPFRDPQYGDLRRIAFDAHTVIAPNKSARILAEFRDGAPALLQHSLGDGRVLWFASSCGRSWSDWPRSRLFVPLVHQMLGDLAGLTGGGPVRSVVLEGNTQSGRVPGVTEDGRRWEVINTSPRESDTERLSAEEFASRFEVPLVSTDRSPADLKQASANERNLDLRNNELWHWVAVGLLGFLCLEAFLANRTAA
jgi:Aerotolerance regulator N-terminal